MSDSCRVKQIEGFIVQENGIVRNDNGIYLGRLEQLKLLQDIRKAAKSLNNSVKII